MSQAANVRKLLVAVLESSPFPWWEWSIPDNRVEFNDLKATMLGYDPAALRGKGYQAFMALVHPEDQEPTMQAMRDHLEGMAPLYQVDYRIRRADGSYTWYMDRGVALEHGSDGRPLLLRGLVIDLGPQLEAMSGSRTLRALVQGALPVGGARDGSCAEVCSGCGKL